MSDTLPRFERGMRAAIHLADVAKRHDLRPFGCIIEDERGEYIGHGLGSERRDDPTAHSEMHAIQEACKLRGGLLQGCTLYSTHEPCTMCAGAIAHAKISMLVYGSTRADLPQLFRRRDHDIREILKDTSTPPRIFSGLMSRRCIALFADEVEHLEAILA